MTEEVANLLNCKYGPQLKELFNFYSKLPDPEIDIEVLYRNNIIQQKSLLKFAQRFKEIPTYVTKENAIEIFNYLIRYRPNYGNQKIKGIGYDDFVESFIRICNIGKCILGAKANSEDTNELKGMNAKILDSFFKSIGLIPEKIEPLMQLLKKINKENEAMMRKQHRGRSLAALKTIEAKRKLLDLDVKKLSPLDNKTGNEYNIIPKLNDEIAESDYGKSTLRHDETQINPIDTNMKINEEIKLDNVNQEENIISPTIKQEQLNPNDNNEVKENPNNIIINENEVNPNIDDSEKKTVKI